MKRAQKATKFLLILLSLAMVLSVFAACSTEDDEYVPDISTDATDSTDGDGDSDAEDGKWAGWPVDENGYLKDTLPDDMNFQDDFYILSASTQQSHYYAEESDDSTVGKAIYKRNIEVEERLGISLSWDHQPCYASADKNAFTTRAETDTQSGNAYDCVVSYNLIPYRLAAKGLAVNLNDTAYINLEMPWWPEEYLDTMLYKDQIFAVVNNVGVGTLSNLSCIYFNNTMLDNKKIESPYDLVARNEWTIPKLKELIKDTYEDKNTDGKVDAGDVFGLCTSTAARITCWYYGAGLRFSSLNAEGDLVLNTNVGEVTDKLSAIVDLFSTDDSLVNDKSQFLMFKEERVYFYLSIVGMSGSMVNSNLSIDYGVVPNPKLNSDQTRYYTHIPNCHDTWFLLKGTQDTDCSSAFIEAMASGAYRHINDVYYEYNVKLRYAPDDRLAEMYDLIRESITFDFAYIYKEATGGDIDTGVRNCIQKPENYQWATVWAGMKDKVEASFQTVLDTYTLN